MACESGTARRGVRDGIVGKGGGAGGTQGTWQNRMSQGNCSDANACKDILEVGLNEMAEMTLVTVRASKGWVGTERCWVELRLDLTAGLEHDNALLLFGGSRVTKFDEITYTLNGGKKVTQVLHLTCRHVVCERVVC